MRPAVMALFSGRRRRLFALLLVLVVAVVMALVVGVRRTKVSQTEDPPPVELAPGQDEALEELLGRGISLPDGCRYVGAELGALRISARYLCPGGTVPHVLDLNVGDRRQHFHQHAGRFGVGTTPGFPTALREALVARIAPRSHRLQWRFRGVGDPWRSTVSGSTVPPSLRRSPETTGLPLARVGREETPIGPAAARPWTLEDFRRLLDPNDPTLGFLAAFGLLVALTLRQLRREPWRVAVALGGVVLFGLWVRLRLALPAPMNAHPFTRMIPQAHGIFRGVVLSWLASRFGWTVYFTDLQSLFTLCLSSLMPLVFFTHARLLFDDARRALVAAALMAALPMHVRFAKSDVIFVLSLVNSSLTFATIYGSLSDPSRAWRVVCGLALPALSVATYLARPENYAFALLDLGALSLYVRADVPRRRVALAAVAIVGAAGYAVVTDLLARYQQNVSEGLRWSTLVHAWEIATDRHANTLINPAMTPPAIPLLALWGGVTLWRAGERRKVAFLVAWLVAFFLINSYVHAPTVTMQARYHLNLVSPVVLLAAAALPSVRRLPELAQGSLATLLLLSPWLHKDFIRDVDFTEMHEHAFLRRYRHLLAPGCTVLEFGPAFDVPSARYSLGLRAPRMSEVNRGGILGEAIGRQIGALPPDAREDTLERFALPDTFVADPPACTYYYESAACSTHGPSTGGLAPACAAMHERFRLELLGEARHAFRPLDDIIVARVVTLPDGTRRLRRLVSDRRGIRLALYRVYPR